MRLLALFFLLLMSICSYAQVYMNMEMSYKGISVGERVTEEENAFLNVAFSLPDKVDFREKKVCFMYGSGMPHEIVTKEVFFNYYKGIGIMYIFDENQKKNAGGCDVAISVPTKKVISAKAMPKYVRKARKRGNSHSDDVRWSIETNH